MKTVLILCSILTIIFISGCSKTIKVPQRCEHPYTEKPKIDNKRCKDNDFACITSKAIRNCEAYKNYSENLEINMKVCN